MSVVIWLWIGFLAVIFVLLALDLGVFNRRAHAISINEAGVWTAIWVVMALVFNVCIYTLYEHHVFGIGKVIGHPVGGSEAALDFLTGYLIEKSLSLDNIFVIALIFTYFHIPVAYQHRVLFWGIVGAVVFRGIMILLGSALISRFEWITYVFGGILIVTAIKLLVTQHESVQPDRNIFVRLARRMYPVSPHMDGPRFFTQLNGARAVTPVFIAMLVVESSDIMFAVDSIPAIFAITHDPFIVFTSNIFAILGLRSLYFVLAGVLDRFRYMKYSLVVLLAFIGVKMLIAEFYHIPTLISLGAICLILAAGVVASLLRRPDASDSAQPAAQHAGAGHEPAAAPRASAPRASALHAEAPPATAGHAASTPGGAPARGELRRIFFVLLAATLLLVLLASILLPAPDTILLPCGVALLAAEWWWLRTTVKPAAAMNRHQPWVGA